MSRLLWCLLLRCHGLITQPTGFRDGGVRGGRKARTQTVVLFFHVPKTGGESINEYMVLHAKAAVYVRCETAVIIARNVSAALGCSAHRSPKTPIAIEST